MIHKHIFITGGGGFLGRYIIEQIQMSGCSAITSLGRSPRPELEKMGVKVIQGDISDSAAVFRAAEGADIVFHTAAKATMWGKYSDFYNTNVKGTENVIAACREHNISILINTSSPSVIASENDIVNGDESIPYPDKFQAYYPETKAEAEKLISEAADKTLRTISLRPHLIWGPRDPHILPRLLEKAAARKLLQIGDGKNRVDLTYVENAASAHIRAAVKLAESADISGKVFFISDDAPVILWEWIASLLKELNLPSIKKTMSYSIARRLASFFEMLYTVLSVSGEPPMTRFVAAQLSHSHFFDISAAKKYLDYRPVISNEQAFEKTVEYFKNRYRL